MLYKIKLDDNSFIIADDDYILTLFKHNKKKVVSVKDYLNNNKLWKYHLVDLIDGKKYKRYFVIDIIANSNFEMWMNQNKDKSYKDFEFSFKKMPKGGTMYDYDKIINISKNFISTLKAEDVYNRALEYALEYDKELYDLLVKYKDYSISVFNIEREQKKPRKDIATWGDVRDQVWYMFDELYNPDNYEWQNVTDKDEIINVVSSYLDKYDSNDDKDTWFNKMKVVASSLGYAGEMKLYKENPDNYKGSIADFSTILRVTLTSKSNTPDLYEIMRLLGKERMKKRLEMIK